jgi:hypothetical protein
MSDSGGTVSKSGRSRMTQLMKSIRNSALSWRFRNSFSSSYNSCEHCTTIAPSRNAMQSAGRTVSVQEAVRLAFAIRPGANQELIPQGTVIHADDQLAKQGKRQARKS